ncbi:fructosamine kinase family protein [Gaoshiqia sp. Z1-71]|uniref:fructosamine kinase family protein n=1 Tax=Gaoshiqia hydrogeniformans TaxID=3290090 RepID=UPI003BF78F0A
MERKIFQYAEEKLRPVFGSGFRLERTEPIGGGCISHTLKIKTTHGHFFLKWNPSCAGDLFVREGECLAELKKHGGNDLLIPEVILSNEADELPGFILMEYLEPGHTLKQDEKLGRGLALLHQSVGEQFGFHHHNYCGSTPQLNSECSSWLDFFRENRLKYILQLIKRQRPLPADEQTVYDKLIESLPEFLPETSAPALIHGDLWSGNYLYTTSGPALIDPASYYADREMELSIMTLFGGFSQTTWDAYQETFPLEKGWQERVQLYQLYHILNHYYLFGGSYGRQALTVARKFI